jgi:intracellular sulfur oxidation DsrE/DsrF family protein
MKQVLLLVLVGGLLFAAAYVFISPTGEQQGTGVDPVAGAAETMSPIGTSPEADTVPERTVLGVSVHTIEGLRVLFDRAEELAMIPRPKGGDASVVLVLHGPEVEFFAIKNYDKYKDIVDQAARLDAFDVVDVKICQTMMGVRGIERNDIPSFVELVPYGPGEVERLRQEGYVAF